MPHEESTIHDSEAQDTAVQAPRTPVYEPVAQEDDWLDEPLELPRRPRRRLLTPVPLTLLGVLLIAGGFIGGVLVEKGQTSSSSTAGGTASRAEDWQWEPTDMTAFLQAIVAGKIGFQFIQICKPAMDAFVRQHKGETKLPGIKVFDAGKVIIR